MKVPFDYIVDICDLYYLQQDAVQECPTENLFCIIDQHVGYMELLVCLSNLI